MANRFPVVLPRDDLENEIKEEFLLLDFLWSLPTGSSIITGGKCA